MTLYSISAVTFILVASLQRGVAIIQWEYEDNQFEYDDEFMGARCVVATSFCGKPSPPKAQTENQVTSLIDPHKCLMYFLFSFCPLSSDIINDVFRVYTVILAIFWVLYLFPHIGFIVEVCNGTMSRETYPREEYSCCCSTTRSRRHTFVDELPEVPYIT